MDMFKKMVVSILGLLDLMETYAASEANNVPYMLKGEVSYLRSVLEDVDRRMKKDLEGYKEAS